MAGAQKLILGAYVLRSDGAVADVIVVNAEAVGVGNIIAVVRQPVRVGQVISPVLRVITVVVLVVLLPIQLSARIDDVDISDTAIQGQRGLIPIIFASGRPESAGFQNAKEIRIVLPRAFVIRLLDHETRRD